MNKNKSSRKRGIINGTNVYREWNRHVLAEKTGGHSNLGIPT